MAHCSVIVTYVFILTSFVMGAITIGGSMYLIFGYNYMYLNRATFDEAIQQLNTMITAINRFQAVRLKVTPNLSNVAPTTEFNDVIKGCGYFTLAFGIVICAITITALIAIIRKSKWLTTLYVVGMVVFLLMELAFVIIYLQFPNIIMKQVGHVLSNSIKESYRGLSGQDDTSMAWNLLMKKYNCCGVDSYQYFNSSKGFSDQWGNPFHTNSQLVPLPAPLACCNSIQITARPKFGGPCHKEDYINKRGCGSVVFHAFFHGCKNEVVGVIAVCCLSQVITIVTGMYIKFKNRALEIKPVKEENMHFGDRQKSMETASVTA